MSERNQVRYFFFPSSANATCTSHDRRAHSIDGEHVFCQCRTQDRGLTSGALPILSRGKVKGTARGGLVVRRAAAACVARTLIDRTVISATPSVAKKGRAGPTEEEKSAEKAFSRTCGRRACFVIARQQVVKQGPSLLAAIRSCSHLRDVLRKHGILR